MMQEITTAQFKPYRVNIVLDIAVEAKNPLIRKLTKKKYIEVPFILPFNVTVGRNADDAIAALKADITNYFTTLTAFKSRLKGEIRNELRQINATQTIELQTVSGGILDDFLSAVKFEHALSLFLLLAGLPGEKMKPEKWSNIRRIDLSSMGLCSRDRAMITVNDVMNHLIRLREYYPIKLFESEYRKEDEI